MSKNIGTLITSSIRPNDSNDPIASAYASEIKGGAHSVGDLSGRNSIIFQRRDWGMLCYVSGEDLTYQLSYNNSSDNILDNDNWVLFESGGGNSNSEWIDSVYSIETNEPLTPDDGDRYLVGLKPSDVITGPIWGTYSSGYVATWNEEDSVWYLTIPTNGMSVRVDDDDNSIYKYEGDFNTGNWYKERINQVVISLNANSVDGVNYIGTTTNDVNVEYSTDMIFISTFSQENNDGPVTININGLGPVVIKKSTTNGLLELVEGDIIPEIIYNLAFDGVNFQLAKPFSEVSPGHKYYIEPNDYIVVPEYYQYWIYGDLTVDGTLVNNGQVIVANGSVVLNSGTFSNYGDLILMSFETGTLTFTNSETISLDVDVDNIVTADVIDDSLLPVKLSTINSATAGYILSNDGSKFEWIEDGKSDFLITDYNTGATFGNISNIIFRGSTVMIEGGGTATGALVAGEPNQVVVWIPAPSYEENFDPTPLSLSYTSRYVMTPTTNGYTASNIDGYYGVGDWAGLSIRSVITTSSHTLFTDSEFGVLSTGTTMSLTIFDETGLELKKVELAVVNGSTSSNGVTLTISNFGADSDRYKASATGAILLETLFPNGGRFSYNVTHNNDGVMESYTSSVYFYESLNTTPDVTGDVLFSEDIPSLVYYSGVAYYKTGSTFGMTVSDINYLNETTIPIGTQIDITDNNMLVSSTHAGSKTDITGWTSDWDVSGLTYSDTATVDQTNNRVPGFSTNNTISTSATSYITARLYDYGIDYVKNSSSYLMLL